MKNKLALITLLIILLPAGLKGFWIGLSLFQKSSNTSVNIQELELQLAKKRSEADLAEPFSPESGDAQSIVADLSSSISEAKSRNKYAKQRPIAYAWIGGSTLFLALWCFAVYIVLTRIKKTEQNAQADGEDAAA